MQKIGSEKSSDVIYSKGAIDKHEHKGTARTTT